MEPWILGVVFHQSEEECLGLCAPVLAQIDLGQSVPAFRVKRFRGERRREVRLGLPIVSGTVSILKMGIAAMSSSSVRSSIHAGLMAIARHFR